ncbi:molybdopterin-guanine dinucleotide biosynthesis protein MobB [Leminorella grimontii]|uniref:molybdopterin-guanine dinucleotide biosynthesis protein MobB n=1 Tax=Leminorella grimontii TaxID=82981 RepID=UPI0020890088|nr:molybdopterin-guanine dinucleotide biosynthesis protein MobB [Leminorella grimontii]GKX60016.1 molybdopterin-guanine dinucleotide biosynthesis protein MobB [Leminorella grimontii]
MINAPLPLLAITAYSGTGKTTLLKKLIPMLADMGIRCGLIKHSHHDVDVDTPGKDSYELRKAGAVQTIVACDQRWALMTETPQRAVNLPELVGKFDPLLIDLVLLEGFKQEPVPKIALYRAAVGRPLDDLLDEYAIALATDEALDVGIPILNINDCSQVAEFIRAWLAAKR